MTNQASNTLKESGAGFLNLVAVIAAFLATPYLDRLTSSYAVDLFANAYGPELAGMARFAWPFLLGGLVFYLCRMVLALAVMVIGSWLMMRMGAFI